MYNGVLSGLSLSRHRVLLRQPAAAPHPPRLRAGRARAARALVALRLLPAQPHAAAQLVAAVPGDQRRHRRPDPPVRRRPTSRRDIGGRHGAGCRCAPATRGTAGSPSTSSQTPDEPWTLSLRVPRLVPRGDAHACPAGAAGRSRPARFDELRPWRPGDEVVLDLDLPVRVTEPDPRVDAVRGCVAFERGPLVYCVESADLPAGTELEDLRWDAAPGSRSTVARARPRRRRGRRRGAGRDRADGSAGDLTCRRDPLLRLGQPRRRAACGCGSRADRAAPPASAARRRRGRVADDQRRARRPRGSARARRPGRGPGPPRGRRRG